MHASSPNATAVVTPRLCGVATGTRLLTSEGYRAVETLSPGELLRVVLGDQAASRPITWIGRRDVILTKRQASERLVRIRRHAIADDVPDRDVYLAQDHALYLQGRLYPIRHCVNEASILFETGWKSVGYWGVQLDGHSVVLADKLPVESLLPECASLFIAVSASDAELSVEIETRTALNMVSQQLVEREVKVMFAVEPQLSVRIKRGVLQNILTGLLQHAILAAPGGHIQLVASRQGNQALVAVDFERAAAAQPEGGLQPLRDAAEAQAGTLDVLLQPPAGVTMMLRLPAG